MKGKKEMTGASGASCESACGICGHSKCKACGVVILILGVLLLLQSIKVITWFPVDAWALVFIIVGIVALIGKKCCN